jgi:glycine/D-amino acid oxidase-like deaminating enzyme
MNGDELAVGTMGAKAQSVPDEVEVAVVGAGPAGLTIASLLAAFGPLVLRVTPGQPSYTRGRSRPSSPWCRRRDAEQGRRGSALRRA